MCLRFTDGPSEPPPVCSTMVLAGAEVTLRLPSWTFTTLLLCLTFALREKKSVIEFERLGFGPASSSSGCRSGAGDEKKLSKPEDELGLRPNAKESSSVGKLESTQIAA